MTNDGRAKRTRGDSSDSGDVVPIRREYKRGRKLTDVGNGERFAILNGEDVRYCYELDAWLVWDNRRWARDNSGEIMRRAKRTASQIFHEAMAAPEIQRSQYIKFAVKSESEPRLRAMITLAESEQDLTVRVDQLDANPWLLTVANGTLDLRTAQLRPHAREDYCTRLVPIAFEVEAPCQLWEKFLNRIMGGNENLVRFLQRAIGYSLTGVTNEHAMFFLYGIGRNGKSTFLDVARALLGEYAMQADSSTLMVRRSEGPREDLARLHGARLVTAIEAGEGQRLDESRVKSLTGGEGVTARELYKNSFTYRPQYKIWLAANHKPWIRGTDEGIWSRIRLVPFAEIIPEEERDRELPQKLAAELSGILAWAVAGALSWAREGLGAPVEVREATDEYRSEMDSFGAFLDDRCDVHPAYAESAKTLYQAYQQWARESGEHEMTSTMFGRKLTDKGFVAEKRGRPALIWRTGLRLRRANVESVEGCRESSGELAI